MEFTITQYAVLAYLCIYYVVIIIWRSYDLYRKTGINPIRNLEKEGINGFIEKVLAFCVVLIPVIVLNFVFIEKNYRLLVPISYLEYQFIAYSGILICFTGSLIAIIAQWQMGNYWRLGLNKLETTTIITHGLFNYSRNPIYLGVFISYIGFFMMMPNAFSLCLVCLSYIALEIKIRLEEEYLTNVQPYIYQQYKKRVPRWFLRIRW